MIQWSELEIDEKKLTIDELKHKLEQFMMIIKYVEREHDGDILRIILLSTMRRVIVQIEKEIAIRESVKSDTSLDLI